MTAEQRIKALDGWKGIAALIIVSYHYFSKTGYFVNGYLMTDFFFIMSGFFWMSGIDSGRIVSTKKYFTNALKRFLPITITVLLCECLVQIIFKFDHFIQHWPRLIYEFLLMHVLGIQNEYYFSPIWYISVMIFVLTVYTGIITCNRRIFLNIFIPIFVIAGYTHLFHLNNGLTDFRHFCENDMFIMGVFRGSADMGIGIVLYNFRNEIISMLQKLKPAVVYLSEVIVIGILVLIIGWRIDVSADILIVPCSCYIVALCIAKMGGVQRLLLTKPVQFVGKLSMYIYLSQGISQKVTTVISDMMWGIDHDSTFSVLLMLLLTVNTILIAFLFKTVIMPVVTWCAKRLVKPI